MINYPFQKNDKLNKNINYKNKGMFLEEVINNTNEYYKDRNIALIYKKPTPIQIVKLSYDKKYIEKAFFKEKSTTDYNGIYKGKYIDFEAKECTSKTSFPLKNIKEYQFKHLLKVDEFGGIGFIIFYFSKLDKFYILFIQEIKEYIDLNPTKSSIPLDYFLKKNHEIILNLNFSIDYLKEIDKIIH